MAKQKEDPNFSLSTVPHAELYVALNARCSTKASRQVCTTVASPLSSWSSRACSPPCLLEVPAYAYALAISEKSGCEGKVDCTTLYIPFGIRRGYDLLAKMLTAVQLHWMTMSLLQRDRTHLCRQLWTCWPTS